MEQEWKLRQANLMKRVQQEYTWAIDQGIAKEQARAVLPEGMMMSRMYVNGTLRSWITYCQLRMGPETQKEHRIVAQQCWDNLVQVYPFLKTLDVGE